MLVDEAPLIRVSSQQVAEVVVDGVPCGTTPALIEVTPGPHRVTATMAGHQVTRVVEAVVGEVVEVDADDAGERARSNEPSDESPPEAQEPWSRRVFQWPMFEVHLLASTGLRSFDVSINPEVDRLGRTTAAFESGVYGALGFEVAFFPLARSNIALLRGLGVEGSAVFDVGLNVTSPELGEEVDASFTEAGITLVYGLNIGRDDLGLELGTRIGWHRTEFYLGDLGNDIVPPFTYDTFRFEASCRVPLGTRHLLVDLGLAYLATLSIGTPATTAYGATGSAPSTHGGEVRLGLLHRVGRIELGLAWHGRWFRSKFTGVGQGWGQDPTTRAFAGGDGIETTGPAHDSIHQLRFAVGYRF